RAQLWEDPEKALARVRQLAGIRPVSAAPKAESRGRHAGGESYTVEKLILSSGGAVPLPALLFVPKDKKNRAPGVLCVSGKGKEFEAGADGMISRLVAEGKIVLSVDLRGFGETAAGARSDKYFGTDFQTALLSIHLNRPLLGQRVEDIFASLNWLAAREDVDA